MNFSREKCAPAQIDWRALARAAHYRAGRFAELLKISLRQLERCFCKSARMSPQAWLDRVRLDKAARMLEGGHAVGEIIFELSFKDHGHFYHRFKERFGCTPQQWIEVRLRGANQHADSASRDAVLPPKACHDLAIYHLRSPATSK